MPTVQDHTVCILWRFGRESPHPRCKSSEPPAVLSQIGTFLCARESAIGLQVRGICKDNWTSLPSFSETYLRVLSGEAIRRLNLTTNWQWNAKTNLPLQAPPRRL